MLSLQNKNVLVTGGAGFIGSHLCDRLIDQSVARLVAVDNLFLGKESNLQPVGKHKNFVFARIDVTNLAAVKKIINQYQIEVIFHLAVVPLEVSLLRPAWCFTQNVKMTQNICEIIRQAARPITLIAYSSSEVYGSARYIPMDENHPLLCHTAYAASKLASDALVYSYYQTFGMDMAIVRPFNNYGPRQNEGSYAGVIPVTIKRIMNGEKPIIYGDGKQTRDFIFVGDTVAGTIKIYQNKKARGEIFNLASGQQIRIAKLIKTICREMKYQGKIAYHNERPGDVRKHQGDAAKAKKLLGFEPIVQFEDGIKKTVSWYRRRKIYEIL